jgi:bacterial/archaeal transporter family-2 protein
MRMLGLFIAGVAVGGLIAVQSVLNAALGKRSGDLGSVFIVALISIVVVVPLLLLFPGAANLRGLPGPSQWYLYIGGAIGILIVGTPIILIPRIGATATLTALVVGQLTLAVIIDHFGLLGVPRSELSATRVLGVAILALGTLLIVRK